MLCFVVNPKENPPDEFEDLGGLTLSEELTLTVKENPPELTGAAAGTVELETGSELDMGRELEIGEEKAGLEAVKFNALTEESPAVEDSLTHKLSTF